MFYHYNIVKKDEHVFDDNTYEIVIYRAEEDDHLNGFISCGGFGDSIASMSGETAHDMKAQSDQDPVEFLLQAMPDEIDAGKFSVPKNT